MKTNSLIVCMLLAGMALKAQIKAPVLSGKEKLEMYQSHEKMREDSQFGDLQWQFIGPTNISGRCTDVEAVGPKGQNYRNDPINAWTPSWRPSNAGSLGENAGTNLNDLIVTT